MLEPSGFNHMARKSSYRRCYHSHRLYLWPKFPTARHWSGQSPMIAPPSIQYELADHVLNIAYNLLAGGSCLEHLELRHNDNVQFVFGFDAIPKLVEMAEKLDKSAWKQLHRKQSTTEKPRARRPNTKEQVVVEKEYKNNGNYTHVRQIDSDRSVIRSTSQMGKIPICHIETLMETTLRSEPVLFAPSIVRNAGSHANGPKESGPRAEFASKPLQSIPVVTPIPLSQSQ